MSKTKSSKNSGFTVVELVVIIAIVISMVFLAYTGYSKFQRRSAENAVKTDLTSAINYVKQLTSRSTNNHNVSLGGFVSTRGVVLNSSVKKSSSYCIVGTHEQFSDMKWHVTIVDTVPKTGDCPEQ